MPDLDRVPELLALGEQLAALRRHVADLGADPDEDDRNALRRIEHGVSRRFWRLAYQIAETVN